MASPCEQTRGRLRDALTGGGVDVVVDAASAAEIALFAQLESPDVAVLDSTAELSATPGGLVELRTANPELPIVVVTAGAGRGPVRKALRAGAGGCVFADDVERALVATVLAVVAGQVAVPSQEREQAVRAAFSFREKQVLDLMARGYTNGRIAKELFLAESTVKTHLSTGFRKLGVNKRAEAAALVLDPRVRLELGFGSTTTDSILVSA